MITAYATNIGQKHTNQDSFMLSRMNTYAGEAAMAVVCDGMGGLSRGELASAQVVRAFDSWFLTDFPKHVQNGLERDELFQDWNKIIQDKNRELLQFGKRENVSLGTTVDAILIMEGLYYIAHVGDTRVYEIKPDGIRCLTKDHSLVMREVELGHLAPEDMERDPRRNILLQCIGAEGGVRPDFYCGNGMSGKVFLICCDGFRHEIRNDEIFAKLNPRAIHNRGIMQENLQSLVDLCLDRGERDNVTAVGIYVDSL